MARRLRIQYPGAMYHVINRGNYRRDIFDSVGAAQAFEDTLAEVCPSFGWKLHAYAIMRNHFHLAVETPEPNLVDGMHWLQSTYATRFNRFRSERGHLFQGRYQSPIIENGTSLVRVVDYIHLNPVKAGIVTARDAAVFRWSSLRRFVRGGSWSFLTSAAWLATLGLVDTADGWRTYSNRLEVLADEGWHEKASRELCAGWAIGTEGWRRAIARELSALKLDPGLQAEEVRELKTTRHKLCLDSILTEAGRSLEEAQNASKGAPWKRAIAQRLRRECGAPYRWIAEQLNMRSAGAVRTYVYQKSQFTA